MYRQFEITEIMFGFYPDPLIVHLRIPTCLGRPASKHQSTTKYLAMFLFFVKVPSYDLFCAFGESCLLTLKPVVMERAEGR